MGTGRREHRMPVSGSARCLSLLIQLAFRKPSVEFPMSAADLLRKLPTAFNPKHAETGKRVIQFDISEPMYAEIEDGACRIVTGVSAHSDVTLTIRDADLEQLLKGELSGTVAFLTGKLHLEGDIQLAQRLGDMFNVAKLA